MHTIRRTLSFPIWLIAAAIGLSTLVLGWLARRVAPWLARGITEHFYWPFVQMQRLVAGTPRWQPQDLLIRKQPHTPEAIKLAREHPDVIEAPCFCSDPACPNKTNPRFAYIPGGKRRIEKLGAIIDAPPSASESVQETFDSLPPEMRSDAIEAMRKVSGYYELKQLVDAQDRQIANMREVIEADQQVIDSDAKLIAKDETLISQQRELIGTYEAELEKAHRELVELRALKSNVESYAASRAN